MSCFDGEVPGYGSLKSYSGLIFYDPSVSSLPPQPIRLNFVNSYDAQAVTISNLNTNTTSASPLSLGIFDVDNGIVVGDLQGRTTTPFIGIATHTYNSGPDNVLFLLALDPNGPGYINIVLVAD